MVLIVDFGSELVVESFDIYFDTVWLELVVSLENNEIVKFSSISCLKTFGYFVKFSLESVPVMKFTEKSDCENQNVENVIDATIYPATNPWIQEFFLRFKNIFN